MHPAQNRPQKKYKRKSYIIKKKGKKEKRKKCLVGYLNIHIQM